uniref:Uncharacterized protein n=1 Tax=Romanomermis culicivorax TaxID=13658 RepID=A0A915HR25_ROMCU
MAYPSIKLTASSPYAAADFAGRTPTKWALTTKRPVDKNSEPESSAGNTYKSEARITWQLPPVCGFDRINATFGSETGLSDKIVAQFVQTFDRNIIMISIIDELLTYFNKQFFTVANLMEWINLKKTPLTSTEVSSTSMIVHR